MERRTTLSYKQHRVDVTVRPLQAGSYIAVVVHDPVLRGVDRCAEYITDSGGLADAFGAGLEIGRALVDGRLQ